MRGVASLFVAMLATHACSHGNRPHYVNTGDAMPPTNDASSSTDANTDSDSILPNPGTWDWAKYEMAGGKLTRRTSWPSGFLVRATSSGYQASNSGGSSWFSTAWTPSSDDTNALNWTSLYAP